jgi:hypothetical protein
MKYICTYICIYIYGYLFIDAFQVHLFMFGTNHEWLTHGHVGAYFDVLCRMLLVHNADVRIEIRTEVILSNGHNT